jgi:ADP-ribose pyrophosphatase
MTKQALRSWTVIGEQELLSRPPFIKVSVQRVALPDGRVIEDYYQLTLPDVVSIFAETVDSRVLVLRSYRHGPRRVCLNFPGGMLTSGEDPTQAAKRELLEETGFQGADWQFLGSFVTNASQRGQTISYFRASGCRRVAKANPGDLEETELMQMSREDLLKAKRNGEIPILSQIALLGLAVS